MQPSWPKILFFVALFCLFGISSTILFTAPLSAPIGPAEEWGLIGSLAYYLIWIFAAASLYVIFSKKYDEATRKWAFGTVGLILGFWLRHIAS